MRYNNGALTCRSTSTEIDYTYVYDLFSVLEGFMIAAVTYSALDSGNYLKRLAVLCSAFTWALVMLFQNTTSNH